MIARATNAFLILSTLSMAACTGSCGEKNAQQGAAPTSQPVRQAATPDVAMVPATVEVAIPNGPWTDLARQLVDSRNLTTATNVTREVLARGGVATSDGSRVLVPAVAPAASFAATPMESIRLAMEARRRRTAARLTAAELAQMLEGFGWPFPGARQGGQASVRPRGQVKEPERLREAEQKEREAQSEAKRAESNRIQAAIEADEQAGRDSVAAANRRLMEATTAWQAARGALARAPVSEKAAAEAKLKEAAAARERVIEERRLAQENARTAQEDRRARTRLANDAGFAVERIERNIGPDYAAGDKLMEMLALWVREAAGAPNDPRSFTPLFLAEMARLQDPPVDLGGSRYTRPGRGAGAPVDLRGAPRSEQLRLTLLEIELMAAAFHRAEPAHAMFAPRDPMRRSGFGISLASFTIESQDPCSDLKGTLGDLGELVGLGASEVAGAALEKAVAAATSEATAEAFSKAMSAVGIAGKIARLVAFYSDGQIAVTVDPTSVHKPLGGTELVGYTARAGVSDEDWQEYQRLMGETGTGIDRAARDCLGTIGMPTFTNLSDLAKEAESWLVDWRLVEGSPPHAYYSLATNDFYLAGRGAMKLKRQSAQSAESIFIVDILPEQAHSGTIVRAYVTARADLDAAGMPSLSTFINPIKGILGLVDALVELGAGWFQYMNMPKAYGTIEVEYHCPRPTTLYPPTGGPPVADGGGGDGPDDCLIAAAREKSRNGR